MTAELKGDERLDDLERDGLKIIQKKNGFCFGLDAVLLTGFARIKEGEDVLDLGTGSGVIPILLSAKSKARHFSGLEIQEEIADMAKRSIILDDLGEKISIDVGDIKEASYIYGTASFDVITVNPPYMKNTGGRVSSDDSKAISRHEVLCTLEDIVRESEKILKPRGRLYIVYRPRRLAELIVALKDHHLEPKYMRLVYPFADKEADMVLIEAVKGGGESLKAGAPLIVFKEPGVYTDEVRNIYGN